MNFAGSFSHIGTLDIAEFRRLVLDLTAEQWNNFSLRQERYDVHRDTQTIGLVYDLDFRHSHPTKLPTLEIFKDALLPVLKMASAHYEESAVGKQFIEQFGLGYFIRATLVLLKAGCSIAEHQDNNFSLTHSHRIHLPIITNDEVRFIVGNESINMREGELFEINNRRMHAVENNGADDRVHLILDYVMPGERCCCGLKHHPDTLCSPQACLETDRQKIPCTCYPESQQVREMVVNNPLIAAAETLIRQSSSKASKATLRQPVIIVSAPRAGSNLLFESLSKIAGFWSIGEESHVIYNAFPDLSAENTQMDSSSLGKSHADAETRRLMRACFLSLMRDHCGVSYVDMPPEQRPPSVTLLEKTPRNALNIPFLLEVFPDARFIYLQRDYRQNIASIIESWTLGLLTGQFVTFKDLPGWDRQAWCFMLPSGWRSMIGKTLAEIAAFQWAASNNSILDSLETLPASRWTAVSYDDLVNTPNDTLADLSRFANIEPPEQAASDGPLPISRTTLTPPDPDKWKKYETELSDLRPGLEATVLRIESVSRVGQVSQ